MAQEQNAIAQLAERLSQLEKSLSERMARIEGVMEQIAERLNHLESRLTQIESRLEARFNWILGIMMTMWVTIILTLFFK